MEVLIRKGGGASRPQPHGPAATNRAKGGRP